MTNWYVRARSWIADRLDPQDGATAVEYALMVALIAIVIVSAVALLGQETSGAFSDSRLITGLS